MPRETPRSISDLAAAFPVIVAAGCVDVALVAWSVDVVPIARSVDVVLVVDWTVEVAVVGARKYEAEDELDDVKEEDADELEVRALLDGATALSRLLQLRIDMSW